MWTKGVLSIFWHVPLDYEGWKRRTDRTQVKGSSYSALGKSSGNLLSRAPAVQPVHGRVDWTSKYGGNR